MKCNYRVNSDLMLELEGANQKELFARMAEAAEIFGNWQQCGKCKSTVHKPRPVVRVNPKKQKYYELHCSNPACRARFTYGQSQDTTSLFPQRKFPKSDKYKPDDGWVVWKPEHEEEGGGDQVF